MLAGCQLSSVFEVGRIQSEKFYLIGFWWRITYSEDMSPGGKYLRVFHLGFRTDFGLPGMSDSFDMVTLMELILTRGLRGLHVFSAR